MLPIRDTIVGRNPPIVTWVLILVNSVVFLFELTMPEPALEQFFYLFGLVPARYTHPTWALWVGLPLHKGALTTPICRSPSSERVFSPTSMSRKTPEI